MKINLKSLFKMKRVSPKPVIYIQEEIQCQNNTKDYHYMSIDELKKCFNISDFNKGLKSAAAKILLENNGFNITSISHSRVYFSFLKSQLNSFTYLLAFIMLISLVYIFLGKYNIVHQGFDQEFYIYYIAMTILNACFILSEVFLALFHVRQSIKSAYAIGTLVSKNVIVIRDNGQRQAISAENLVIGDIICLHTNERIYADVRIIENRNLRIDKSVLTGESDPVEATLTVLHENKRINYLDATNMVFANSIIVYGR